MSGQGEEEWPRLCVDFDEDHPPDVAVCRSCTFEVKFNPEDGSPSVVPMHCPQCAGPLVEKWDVGVECDNCGGLAYEQPITRTAVRCVDGMPTRHLHACSRACSLQLEWMFEKREQLV